MAAGLVLWRSLPRTPDEGSKATVISMMEIRATSH
jgi:hypothetical protein